MLRVTALQSRPGMVLAMPVLHPSAPDRVLLKPGFVLDEHTVGSLREHRVDAVWVRYPGLEFVERFVCPEVYAARGALQHAMGTIFDRMTAEAAAPLEYDAFRRCMRDFLGALSNNPSAGLMLQSMSETKHPLVRHSSDVCYLALLMGLRLEEYLVQQRARLPVHRARDVVDLGLASILHDIGMLELDEGVYENWLAGGCDETDADWRRHVKLGHDRVRGQLSPAACAAILHHHQRFDGSGFPLRKNSEGEYRALAGEEIHIFARILLVADLFDRFRTPMDGSATTPSVRVLRQMQQRPVIDWIDPVVFRALLAVAPAYPPGSMVRLSDGREAAVVDWSPADPCRPTVVVLDDEPPADDGPYLNRVDLRDHKHLIITHVDGVHVEHDNFFPKRYGEFALYVANTSAVTPLESEDDPAESEQGQDADDHDTDVWSFSAA